MANVADRLANVIKDKKSLLCVGLDPRVSQIPKCVTKNYPRGDFDSIADAIVDFNQQIIEATADLVVAFKPQMAFYEQYGPACLHAFKKTVDCAKQTGTVVIEDGKRNDIGSTTDAYADGHLGVVVTPDGKKFPSLDVDMLTVNPYLGTDTIKPFQRYCREKGIFVLCRTSNPSAVEVQDRLVDLEGDEIDFVRERLTDTGLSLLDLPAMKKGGNSGKAPLYVVMAKLIDGWGRDFVGECGYSSVGAVVGATYPKEAKVLRRLMPRTWFLVPGYGAQGGTAKDVPNFVGDDGLGAVANSSRDIIFAYEKSEKYGSDNFSDAAREAATAARDKINKALQEAGKWGFG